MHAAPHTPGPTADVAALPAPSETTTTRTEWSWRTPFGAIETTTTSTTTWTGDTPDAEPHGAEAG